MKVNKWMARAIKDKMKEKKSYKTGSKYVEAYIDMLQNLNSSVDLLKGKVYKYKIIKKGEKNENSNR